MSRRASFIIVRPMTCGSCVTSSAARSQESSARRAQARSAERIVIESELSAIFAIAVAASAAFASNSSNRAAVM